VNNAISELIPFSKVQLVYSDTQELTLKGYAKPGLTEQLGALDFSRPIAMNVDGVSFQAASGSTRIHIISWEMQSGSDSLAIVSIVLRLSGA
jgi:hypothetical protein